MWQSRYSEVDVNFFQHWALVICITTNNRFLRSIVICFVFHMEVRAVTRKMCLGRSFLRANNRFHRSIVIYRVFRHIGSVYTIIGAFCQETHTRATSPNGCKPLQADKWPRLQRGATKCVFMTQTAAISKKVHVQSPLSPKSHPSFVLRAFSVLSWGFHGVRHLTFLLSISGRSWHQSLCTMVLYKPILHVLEEWGETKIGRTPQLKKSLKNSYKIVSCLSHRKLWKGVFLTAPPQSGETSPNRVKQVRVNIKISDFSPKHYTNLGRQGNPNS